MSIDDVLPNIAAPSPFWKIDQSRNCASRLVVDKRFCTRQFARESISPGLLQYDVTVSA